MSNMQDYKCPNCGGALEFNVGVQNIKCPFCDTEINMAALKELDEQLEKRLPSDMTWDTQAGSEWQEGETEGMNVYVCRSCGGEIIGDDNMAATACPFCDNPVVLMGQFSGDLKPNYLIPFKLDKKAAKEALNNHLLGKRFLPKIFKDQNHIDEVKGVYVPFWLFDTDADADMEYIGTRSRRWSDANYDYLETSYYSVLRSGQVAFEHIPVDGSSKIDNDLMESIEPYDFSQAVDFQTAYLAGYLADKYDVTAEDSVETANKRVKKSTQDSFAATVTGFETVTPQSEKIRLSNGKTNYVLYPVWLLHTSWNDQHYIFAMNGQTGKFVGDLPLDKAAYSRWLVGLSVVLSLVIYALVWGVYYIM